MEKEEMKRLQEKFDKVEENIEKKLNDRKIEILANIHINEEDKVTLIMGAIDEAKCESHANLRESLDNGLYDAKMADERPWWDKLLNKIMGIPE